MSLSWVKYLYHVTYSISKGKCFTVHKRNGGARLFVEFFQGLYWLNNKDSYGTGGTTLPNIYDEYSSKFIPYILLVMVLINSVQDNGSGYT